MRYSAIDKLNLFFKTYMQMFANTFKPSSWAPFFYLALAQALGLILLTWFAMPGWKEFIQPLLSQVLPSQPFHYPFYLLTVPRVFTDFDNYILGPTFWVIFSAVAVYKLGGLYEGKNQSTSRGFGLAFRSYIKLLFIWLFELILVFAIFKVLSLLFVEIVFGSPRRIILLKVILQYMAFIPSAFLLYAFPSIIIGKKSFFGAIGESFSLCSHNFFMTYFIVFFPGTIRLIFDIIIRDFGPRIVYTLNPDLILWLMGLKIIFGIGINLFILGGATYLYRDLTR